MAEVLEEAIEEAVVKAALEEAIAEDNASAADPTEEESK